jgi:hypothetical protein
MDEFSITRPEPATPAPDPARHESPSGDRKKRRSPPEMIEPAIPEPPEAAGDDDISHQVDELA